MNSPADYYADPHVRERIAEYCGGVGAEPMSFSAGDLVGYGAYLKSSAHKEYFSSDVSNFHWILDHGLDIFRSVWDKESTVVVLDVEYFNIDYPGEIYHDPAACFLKLEPFHEVVQKKFQEWGIPHLTIMTGQGYHFAFKVLADSPADQTLERIGCLPDSLVGKYTATSEHRHRRVSLKHGRAFDGLGRVMEYVGHELVRATAGVGPVPVVFSDIAVGSVDGRYREAISVDLTAYGDPIFMRDIRCPFSTHQKHKVQVYKVGQRIAREIPVQISLPRRPDPPLHDLLTRRRNFAAAAEVAKTGDCILPGADDPFDRLIRTYLESPLAAFHREFDSADHDPWQAWPRPYDRLKLSTLPPCIALPIRHPNPSLLQPTHVQNVVRYLFMNGWHPKHIGGLIRSKYERPYGWSEDWTHFDACSRANFWARLYAGALAAGLDGLTDFNCVSMQERRLCPKPWCGHNLADIRPRPAALRRSAK